MKLNSMPSILLTATLFITTHLHTYTPLTEAPQQMDQFKEIATQYNDSLPALFNLLTPPERVFAYYLYRASLPGDIISADQIHRDAVTIIDCFTYLVEHKEALRAQAKTKQHYQWTEKNTSRFIDQVELYAVYLWTNHGQYFAREHVNEKRSPKRLDLDLLTPKRIIQALEWLDYPNARATITTISPSIFDEQIEPTASLPDDIEHSASNIYSSDFTEQDFKSLSPEDRALLSAYYYVETVKGSRIAQVQPYSTQGHYAKELSISVFWLQKAYEHAKKHPTYFDTHMIKSLELLIAFLNTGNEELFKQHSIEWLKSDSRIDYTFGFIETYRDPKNHIGSFESDITIKAIDITSLNQILPHLEGQLPFPEEYKRKNLDDLSAIPNASVNVVLHSTGDLGPMNIIAAYCLPNYDDIRAEYGSKQIIYQSEKRADEQLNPDLYRNLMNLDADIAWLEAHDPDGLLARDIWDVHVILHETLGHGSGAWHLHTFKAGDPLTIQDITYTVGDTIPVTNDNSNEFLGAYSPALEELRAEIIALYTSIFMFDELANAGLFKQWPEKIGKEILIDRCIIEFAKTGLYRLLGQDDDATTISGAHALANTTIMNYLLDHGGLKLVEETHTVDEKTYTVLGFVITDRDHALAAIKELAIRVQTIKSTADGLDCKALIGTYGEIIRNTEYIGILKHNRDAASNGIKATAHIFPTLIPIIEEDQIVDIAASWPENIIEQCLTQHALALSTEL